MYLVVVRLGQSHRLDALHLSPTISIYFVPVVLCNELSTSILLIEYLERLVEAKFSPVGIPEKDSRDDILQHVFFPIFNPSSSLPPPLFSSSSSSISTLRANADRNLERLASLLIWSLSIGVWCGRTRWPFQGRAYERGVVRHGSQSQTASSNFPANISFSQTTTDQITRPPSKFSTAPFSPAHHRRWTSHLIVKYSAMSIDIYAALSPYPLRLNFCGRLVGFMDGRSCKEDYFTRWLYPSSLMAYRSRRISIGILPPPFSFGHLGFTSGTI